MSVKRPVWSFFIPSTLYANVRRVAYFAPHILFALSATAVVLKQSNYRATLADEDAQTADRIDRRAYVALPDGRVAQVHPYVNMDFTLCGLWGAFKETFSMLP
jgi:hypothetical protein